MKDVAGPALLWIDDEITRDSAVVQLLELEGYKVDCAASGAAGLAMARTGEYHGILLDLRLPDIPGLAVLATLRADAINAPVLVLTGFGDTDSAFAARHFGADGFKCKPLLGDELSTAVQQTLQRAQPVVGATVGDTPSARERVHYPSIAALLEGLHRLSRNQSTAVGSPAVDVRENVATTLARALADSARWGRACGSIHSDDQVEYPDLRRRAIRIAFTSNDEDSLMRMMLRAFRAATFALGCVAAAEASAQEMTISAYDDQWADANYVFHGIDYYDDTPSWVCSHGNYTTLAALTGPTGFASWEPGGLSSSVGLPYAAGDFLGESGLSFDCSCVYPDRVEFTAYMANPFQILPIPDSETSEFTGWSTEPWRTRGEYRMTLHGGAGESFAGRQVIEEQLSGQDSCHPANPGQPLSPFDPGKLTGLFNIIVDGNDKWEKYLVIAALGVAAAATGTGAYAQAAKRVSVDDSRPLAEAHLELVQQARSLVTYEDAYYEYKAEMFDSGSEAHPLHPARNRPEMWLAPPRRTLVFDYSTADLGQPDVLFGKLLSHYHVQYFDSSEYRLLREGQWLHILPKTGKNAKGDLIERASRLDVRVTFPDSERTVEATVKLLIEVINKTAPPSTNILFGVGADGLFNRAKVRTGAQNETARHVLMRVLESTGKKVTWRLLCTFDSTPDRRTDIGDGACGLNFMVLE